MNSIFYGKAIQSSNTETSFDKWEGRTILRAVRVHVEETLSEDEVCKKRDAALKDIFEKQDEFLKEMQF